MHVAVLVVWGGSLCHQMLLQHRPSAPASPIVAATFLPVNCFLSCTKCQVQNREYLKIAKSMVEALPPGSIPKVKNLPFCCISPFPS